MTKVKGQFVEQAVMSDRRPGQNVYTPAWASISTVWTVLLTPPTMRDRRGNERFGDGWMDGWVRCRVVVVVG